MTQTVFSQTFKVILASIFFASTAFSADVKANSNQAQTFKIIPKRESKDLGIYIAFQILPDNSILFSECRKNQCRPLFDQAIPAEKFEALLKKINQQALSKEKFKPWREFFVGAGVTHISVALLTGITATITSTIASSLKDGIKDGLGFGFLYLFSPAGTALVAAMGVGAGEGAAAAAVAAAAGAAAIAVAVLGGLGYVYYKSRSRNKTPVEPDNTLEMNVTMAELTMMVQTMALGVNTTPSSLMP